MDVHILLACVFFCVQIFQAQSRSFTEEDCPGKLKDSHNCSNILLDFYLFLQFVYLQLTSFRNCLMAKPTQKLSKTTSKNIAVLRRMIRKKGW